MSTGNSTTNGIVRGIGAAAGGGMVVGSNDELIQLVGALVTVLSIVWSIVEKIRSRPPGPPTPPPAAPAAP